MQPFSLALLAACVAFVAPAWADRYALDFKATALLLPLGSAHFDVAVAPDRYDVIGALQSDGLLSLFEKTDLKVSSSGVIEDSGPHWRRYDLDHHYAQKHRIIAMSSDGAAISATITPTFRLWGDPPANDAQKLESLDPLSTLVAMGVAVGRKGCNGVFPVFDGRFRYDLDLSDAGRDTDFESGGYQGPVVRCTVRYIPVAGYSGRDGSKAKQKKVPSGEIWFATPQADAFAPPVRAVLPLPLGHATIRLSRWVKASVAVDADPPADPAPETAPETVPAAPQTQALIQPSPASGRP
jgi:hypothetical protein